jgi:ParB-like chromosome segregation protein Spo0J
VSQAELGFVLQALSVPVDTILPSRKVPEGLLTSRKFAQIKASIEAVGLIEPLSVGKLEKGKRVLLDGHIRLIALRDLGYTEVTCLEAKDDESFSYNNRINRLSSIQEHHMLRRAVERGVSAERLAKALSVDVSLINKKVTLLDGLCTEVVDLLKDQTFSADVARALRKMKPTRQVECAELMISANTITASYVEAMLLATPAALLVDEKKTSQRAGVTQEQMAKMEREMGNLQRQYKLVEQTYGQDVLNLVLARGYLTKLLANKPVVRYLKQNQPELLVEFEGIVQAASLDH